MMPAICVVLIMIAQTLQLPTQQLQLQAHQKQQQSPPQQQSAQNTTRTIWVKTLSSIPFTKGSESLLAKGQNFAVVPLYPPKGEYITAVDKVCQKHDPKGSRRVQVRN